MTVRIPNGTSEQKQEGTQFKNIAKYFFAFGLRTEFSQLTGGKFENNSLSWSRMFR